MISDDTASYTKVPFTEEDVKKYLDHAISYWRKCPPTEMQSHYVDAYQSVRVSLFGELLPKEEVIRS